MRAFTVLRQLLVPERVTLLAAADQAAAIDEAGAFVAEATPQRLALNVNLAIRAIRRYVAILAAIKTFHLFAPYYSYRQNKHLAI